ncbi:uncharacterized protein LOC144744914 [Ciona intestinalis]
MGRSGLQIFPDNCDTYYGPHSVQCLTTIWEWKGCLNEGTKAPVKLDHADKEAVDLLTVEQVLDNFELVKLKLMVEIKLKDWNVMELYILKIVIHITDITPLIVLLQSGKKWIAKSKVTDIGNLTTADTDALKSMNLA